MKVPGYIAIALAAILLLWGANDGWQNEVNLKSSVESLNREQARIDYGLEISGPMFSWQQEATAKAVIGVAFLITGIVLIQRKQTFASDRREDV